VAETLGIPRDDDCHSAINTLDAAAGVAYTDTYLNAKTKSSDISSRQLTEYVRRGQRWFTLAGPSPFLLSEYSSLAETIVYVLPAPFVDPSILNTVKSFNNSIKLANLRALAGMVEVGYPKLVSTLVTFDDNERSYMH
jgi:hypothetical protein